MCNSMYIVLTHILQPTAVDCFALNNSNNSSKNNLSSKAAISASDC